MSSDVVADLAARGVRVAVTAQGGLSYRGPRSALTPEVLAILREHKEQIVAALGGATGGHARRPRHETPSECVAPLACSHLGVCGRLDCLPTAIRPTVANLLRPSVPEWSAYAAEVASAGAGDPWIGHDCAALSWAGAIRAAHSPANLHRPIDVPPLESDS